MNLNTSASRRNRANAIGLAAVVALVHTTAPATLRAASLDPTQVERGLQDSERRFIPAAPRGDGPSIEARPEVEAIQDTGTFLLAGVQLSGADLLPADELISAYESHVATEVDEQTIMKIVERITTRLKDAGYPLSYARIPPQHIVAGILTIDIVAGRVGKLTMVGTDTPERYRPIFRTLLEAPVATQDMLERAILLLHDSAGVSVSDIALQEDEDRQGVYELSLALVEKPLEFSVYTDNRGTRAAGPLQLGLSATYNNPLGLNDQIGLTYFTAPETPEELQYFQGSYLLPIGPSGLTMRVSSTYNRVDAGGSLASVGTESSAFSTSVALRYPLKRSRSLSIWAGAKADFRDAREENDFGTVFDDRLVVLRWHIDFASTDRYGGGNFLSAEISQGLSVAGASRRGDPALSRADGGGSFTKLSGEIHRQQELFVTGLSLSTRLAGQISSVPLLSAEEFGLGGARFGRAYQYGELTGDDGLSGSLELAYSPEMNVGPLSSPTGYLFYDIGAVWNGSGLPPGRDSLSSAGAGIRFNLGERTHVGLEIAKPLTRDADEGNGRGPRFFFSLAINF
ncbi:MAG: ShlB/FhaC/HecB family hemolysin secretion/activation protein [Parvibaculum sp.]|uniref:ShlB/FhaC/HecB family hemolysin secretion/activation protein n=1 Tax=Parvibaculum sp. TaxID=2024848 RepID=UPI00271843CA|nr:ShlB/FhaC/HecB family hemolysin secretion/activation protein [Parvibaculum sp.]MDO8840229.1 ShlB/FhaC/HecB family hemolysin secretion/activation protein [Parvibaculum sp.]